MHKKISVGLCVTIAIITLILTAMVTTAVTMNIYGTLVTDLNEREALHKNVAELDSIIRNNYYGKSEADAVSGAMLNGYLAGLDKGINYYMTAEQYRIYNARQTGTDKNGNPVASVENELYNGVGYIKIKDFTDKTPDEFFAAYTTLSSSSCTGLIIDVRNTESINIDSAAKIIDMIVPLATQGSQSIATAVNTKNETVKIFSADAASINLPISVIVNENTSGAGEILACDIRDFGKGTIVGKTTAGEGMYQQVFELSDSSAVVITVAKLLPYNSDCYDGVGVVPDYEAELQQEDSELKDDTQFLQAYASVTTL